jgi:hypothetical protein
VSLLGKSFERLKVKNSRANSVEEGKNVIPRNKKFNFDKKRKGFD